MLLRHNYLKTLALFGIITLNVAFPASLLQLSSTQVLTSARTQDPTPQFNAEEDKQQQAFTDITLLQKNLLDHAKADKLITKKVVTKVATKPAAVAAKATPNTVSVSKEQAITIIAEKCAKYNCNPYQVEKVMYCESGGRFNAINPAGPYIGFFQFLEGTFNSNAKRAGISSPNIWNGEQQIEVAAYMFSKGQAKQWGCK